jgi:hypothetical protein
MPIAVVHYTGDAHRAIRVLVEFRTMSGFALGGRVEAKLGIKDALTDVRPSGMITCGRKTRSIWPILCSQSPSRPQPGS